MRGVSESKLIPSNVKVEPRREKERDDLLTVLSRTSGHTGKQLRPEAEVNL